MGKDIRVEVCANSVLSAIEAEKGGAFRVELCENIPEGGCTPSAGAIVTARKKLSVRMNVIIRPRGGDFLYTEEEFQIMKQDILFCKDAGVDGVVFGILDKNGNVDIQRNIELVELARPMSATFHRAFDVTCNPVKALEDIINIGFDTILTSGCEIKAMDGKQVIKDMIKQAAGRIDIMPGSGISKDNIVEMANITSANTFHLSARRPYPSQMQFRTQLPMGSLSADEEWNRKNTDADIVAEILKVANA